MNQLPEDAFDIIWDERSKRGNDIRGYAEDLFKAMHKAKLPQEIITLLTELIGEIGANIDWLVENCLTTDGFTTWQKNTFHNHIHVNGEVYLPASSK